MKEQFPNLIEISKLPEIRISSASFVRISDNEGRFALLLNKVRASKGEIVLSPVGGGIEATSDGLESLRRMLEIDDSTFERGNDLRFRMAGSKVNKYREWFLQRQGREIDSSREVSEELVDEEALLTKEDLNGIDLGMVGYGSEIEVVNKNNKEITTLRLIEIFDAKIKNEILEKLKNFSEQPNSVIYFVTLNEIKTGKTVSGLKIAKISNTLINPQKTIKEFL